MDGSFLAAIDLARVLSLKPTFCSNLHRWKPPSRNRDPIETTESQALSDSAVSDACPRWSPFPARLTVPKPVVTVAEQTSMTWLGLPVALGRAGCGLSSGPVSYTHLT